VYKMQLVLGLVILVITTSSAQNAEELGFIDFARQYNKQYTQSELFHRFDAFSWWRKFVSEHNAKNETWTAAVHEGCDITPEELRARYAGRDHVATPRRNLAASAPAPNSNVDWRIEGAVTVVKNQGQCGADWAFSTTGSVEGFTWIQTQKLTSMSEQELIDCDRAVNKGCITGEAQLGLWFAQKNGLCSESTYPYTGVEATCKSARCSKVSSPFEAVGLGNSENELQIHIEMGPVAAHVDGSDPRFYAYHDGVFAGSCANKASHAVLVVGCDENVWIVKNSWGAQWGRQGYVYMKKGDNPCGLADAMAWPE